MPPAPALLLLPALLCLPWSTSLHEIGTALALAAAVWRLQRGGTEALWGSLATAPALLLAVLWASAGLLPPDIDGIGHAWLLAPLIAGPVLLAGAAPEQAGRLRQAGLWSAALAGIYAAIRQISAGAPSGATSHHLTLAWMTLPPLAVAIRHRQVLPAIGLLAGLAASGGRAAIPAALLMIPAAWSARVPPWSVAVAGSLLTLLLLPLAPAEDQATRALLWTGALQVDAPAGSALALARMEERWEALSPGFWFPWHAHDALLQHRAVMGAAGWGAAILLLVSLLRAPGGYAVAGAAVGLWTQDILGDLEVARCIYLWWVLEQRGLYSPDAAAPAAPAGPGDRSGP